MNSVAVDDLTEDFWCSRLASFTFHNSVSIQNWQVFAVERGVGERKFYPNYFILLVLNGDLVDPKYVNFSIQAFLCLNLSAL